MYFDRRKVITLKIMNFVVGLWETFINVFPKFFYHDLFLFETIPKQQQRKKKQKKKNKMTQDRTVENCRGNQ